MLREFSLQESGLEGTDQEKVLRDCIQKIRKKKLKKDESDLLKRIKKPRNRKVKKDSRPFFFNARNWRGGREVFRKITLQRG
jgi:hypothetical protein